ncbi:hypothetical protein [Legionella yabuuchiae]|uniref:hypothetical protein n=1 Tax=Legionella yabuuchiae TaxID=376727 RepID=UPI0010557749|nr:hypothetical protein [Legionella yabuuchiae]
MKQLLCALFFFLFSFCAIAADIPEVEQGAEDYDETMCVQRYTDNCINMVCLTSEERDCQEQCQKDAEDKCKLQGL